MRWIKSRTVAALFLAAVGTASLPAYAANGGPSTGGDSAQTQSSEHFTDKQLKQFVKAQANVQAVMKKWDAKTAKADDKKTAQQNENKAMLKAVKASGLTPQQYNRIAQQAQKDPKLTKQIQSFMTPQ